MLVPRSATTSIRLCRNSRRASGSRLATGSSRRMTSGRFATAMVRASWARWPPDSDPPRWRGLRPSRAIRCSARSPSQPGLSQAPIRRCPATDSRAYTGASCATKPTLASCPGLVPGWPPRTVIVPAVGVSSPAASCSRVVLPAPFGPTSPTTFPAGMVKVQSLSAHCRPYFLPAALVWIIGLMRCLSLMRRPPRSSRGMRSGRSPRCRRGQGPPSAPSAATRSSKRGTAPERRGRFGGAS